jgi:hypothetical protein
MIKGRRFNRVYRQVRPYKYAVHKYRIQSCLRNHGKERITVGDYLRSLDNHAMATYFFENYQCHLFDNPAVECLDYDSRSTCVQCWESFLNTKILKG